METHDRRVEICCHANHRRPVSIPQNFQIEILETLGDEDDLLPMYRVRVTETREHEDGDGVLVHLNLES